MLSESNQLTALLPPFLATLALAVKEGVTFLPDAGAGDHDDLLYKLVEHAHYLPRFRGAFEALFTAREKRAMGLLVHVSGYYSQLLEEEKKGAGGKQQQQQLSPAQVVKVIRKGYEGLTISEDELGEEGGWGVWQPWREGDERGLLKRVARVAVEDARKVGRE